MCLLEIILTNLATIDYCDVKFGNDVLALCQNLLPMEACWCPLEFLINPRWLPNAKLHVFISKGQSNSDTEQIRHTKIE